MNEELYQMYKEQKSLVNNPQWAKTPTEKDVLADMKPNLVVMEEKRPEYKERYEREQNDE